MARAARLACPVCLRTVFNHSDLWFHWVQPYNRSSRVNGDVDLESEQLQCLEAMGIEVWVPRGHGSEAAQRAPAKAVGETRPEAPPLADELGVLDWQGLEARVAACTACSLHETRTQTVFGVGNRQAEWMIIGEAPGADEDRQGEPFVGRAGQLLNAMFLALGLQRSDVYIANILKCRPPRNRDPLPEEVVRCAPFLRRQVELISPKIILAVGRVAAQNLLKTEANVGRLRGRVFEYEDTGIPLVVTYHPAYLLRSPREKRKAWQDLELARKTIGK